MDVLDLVKLPPLMERTAGQAGIIIGLIDGPVVVSHSAFTESRIREIPGKADIACRQSKSTACLHGTFIAGILCAKRGTPTPGLCPGCTLLIRPVFSEVGNGLSMPSAKPEDLATAIIECLEAGARILNLSLALAEPSIKGEQALEEALDQAVRRGVLVVAAAGNQGTLGSTAITRHPWVIPVVACDLRGKPSVYSNLGPSIGRRGLCAPGERITSLGVEGQTLTLSGTSVATPFVTGAIALLWSEFPTATAAQLRLAITQAHSLRRTTVVPPLLDTSAAYQLMLKTYI